jgi:NAD+ synthase
MRIALSQLNQKVGDLAGNAARIRAARDRAAALGADLVVCPELSIVGYPPEDLVLRPAFVTAAARTLEELRRESRTVRTAVVVGLPWVHEGSLYNAAALVHDGEVQIRFKRELPNYGVFDEKRVFVPGPLPEPVVLGDVRIGLPICEDIWFPDVMRHLASRGAGLALVPNGSPFEVE